MRRVIPTRDWVAGLDFPVQLEDSQIQLMEHRY